MTCRACPWRLALALVLAPALAAPPARAAEAPAFDLAVSAGSARYTAEEARPDGRPFNRERGSLPVRRVALTAVRGALQLTLKAEDAGGDLAYVGQTQFGIPLFTRTRLAQRALDLGAARRVAQGGPGPSLDLLAGLAVRRQERAIQPTALSSMLTETLHEWPLAFGLGLAGHGPAGWGDWTWAVQGRALWPWRQRLAVDAGASFDPVELEPERHAGRDWGVALRWQASPRLSVSMAADGRSWRPGPAAPVVVWRGALPIGRVSYPGSRQRQQGLHLGMAVAF